MKIEITEWRAVGEWRWKADDDTCGICRQFYHHACPECNCPGDDCPIVWGQCNHCFHMHCIMKWINSVTGTEQRCPMCRQIWKIKE